MGWLLVASCDEGARLEDQVRALDAHQISAAVAREEVTVEGVLVIAPRPACRGTGRTYFD